MTETRICGSAFNGPFLDIESSVIRVCFELRIAWFGFGPLYLRQCAHAAKLVPSEAEGKPALTWAS